MNPLIHAFIHSTTNHPLSRTPNQPPIHPPIFSSNICSLDNFTGHCKVPKVQSLGQQHHLGTDRNAHSWPHPKSTESENRTAICVGEPGSQPPETAGPGVGAPLRPPPAPAAVTLSTAVPSWPRSPGVRAGLCLPGPPRAAVGEARPLFYRRRGVSGHPERPFVFRRGRRPSSQGKHLCEHTWWGASGEADPSPLLRQAWTRSVARPRTTLLVWGSTPGSACDLG